MQRFILQLFFFASRRRHTRLQGDWEFRRVLFRSAGSRTGAGTSTSTPPTASTTAANPARSIATRWSAAMPSPQSASTVRSEERRVGKECRARGWPDGEEKEQWKNVE